MTISAVQPNGKSPAFSGNRIKQAKQLIGAIKENNRIYFKPNLANKYERFSAQSPTCCLGFVMAQMKNIEQLIKLPFTGTVK